MSESSDLSRRDLERLSAYIDGELTARQAAGLEARLESDPTLRRALREMRWTVSQLGMLPEVRAARNFTLTPEMAGVRTRRPAYPVLRLATALAMVAFLVTVGIDLLLPGPVGSLGLRAGDEPAAVEMVEEMAAQDEAEEGEAEAEAPMAMEAPAEPAAEEEEGLQDQAPMTELGTPAPLEATQEAGELLPSTPPISGEEERRAVEFTATPEGVGGGGEMPGEVSQEQISPTATPEGEQLETPPPPGARPEDGLAPGGPWPPLVRLVELGLGVLALVLLGLTLRARRPAR